MNSGMQPELKGLKKSRLYSEELGINLASKKPAEIFKWFLASTLFGARIPETIAKNTYKSFERHHLLEPKKILKAGWNYLVNPVMRQGGYVRYDEKTSTKVLRNCKTLLEKYRGNLNTLHESARNSRDLEKKLMEFYGVGPVTANIFLRELRPYWGKADPETLPETRRLAKKLRINLNKCNRKTLAYARVEAGLIRLRKKAHENYLEHRGHLQVKR